MQITNASTSNSKWFTADSSPREIMKGQLSQLQDCINKEDYPNALEVARGIIIACHTSPEKSSKLLFDFIEKTTKFKDTKTNDILEIRQVLIEKFVKMINHYD